MSDKAKWAVIYLVVALVPFLTHLLAAPNWAKSDAITGLLVFAPYLGLLLTAILGWQINQTRVFWSALFLLGLYALFLKLPDQQWTPKSNLVCFEIISASLPLALSILFLIKETPLWSDRTLARILLALTPALLFFTLSKWAYDVYKDLFYWGFLRSEAFLGVSNLAWASTGLFLLVAAFLPDLRIKPFLTSLSVVFIPILFSSHACHQALLTYAAKTSSTDMPSAILLKNFDVITGFTAVTAILLHSILHMYWRKVYMDVLTGVPNRQALDEKLHSLSQTYALAMVDIDHFKKFNDTYGHAEGDNVLRMVAQHLEEHLGDRVYRYGGEEFCAVFAGDSLQTAENMMEKTRHTLEKRKFRLRQTQRKKSEFGNIFGKKLTGGRIVHITVSIGVAATGKDPANYEQVIKRADKCLYEAKDKGRNRVVSEK